MTLARFRECVDAIGALAVGDYSVEDQQRMQRLDRITGEAWDGHHNRRGRHHPREEMIDARVPSAVALYALTRDGSMAAARFRWERRTGVTLEVLDERWEEVARALFRDGLTLATGRRVTAAEGGAFMRGLLQPGRMTYYHFVDESMERRPRPEPLLEPHPGWKLCPECEGKRFCPACDGQGWWSPEQRCRMCARTAECYLCGGGGEVRLQPPEDEGALTREEFDRRLASIERRLGGGYGEPAPTKAALDAAYAALADLAREPSSQADRSRRRSLAAVGEMLERTYAALGLAVPDRR